MRSDDEEENDYEEDEDEDEEELRDDGGKEEADFEDDQFEDGEADGDEADGDEADGDDDEDDDDDDGEGDGDDEDDDEEEDDEDDDDDDEDEDGNDDDEGAADQADQEMDVEDAEVASRRSKTEELKPILPGEQPQPPHMLRRKLFIPGYAEPPSSLTIEAVVGIPLPSAVHAMASTTCLSYLLTGSQDGFVRSYDFWGSVNGAQLMTAQQRAVVGLGEGVHKAGVGRGWWSCDVPVADAAGATSNKTEPVFSLACQPEGIWALAGSQTGPINLYSLRHEPGHLITSLKGHSNVVSCLQLLDTEPHFISGSWDGSVKEWDLNTGQVVRTYPTHGAQVSSIGLRPLTAATSTSPPPENGDGPSISVNVGPDFFTADQKEEDGTAAETAPNGTTPAAPAAPDADVTMADGDADADGEGDDAKSNGSYDPLFDDDDAEGEEESKAGDVTMADALAGSIVPAASTPTPAPKPPSGLGLALPGATPKASPGIALPGSATTKAASPPTANGSSAATPHLFGAAASTQAGSSRAAAASIPLLSPAEYRQFSNDILLTSSMDGQVTLIDRRVPSKEGGEQTGVGRLMPGDKAPPWCMSATWLGDGNQVLAGRRNGTIDIWDVRKASPTAPSLLRTLKTPADSGPISCIVAFPDGRHIATASQDNIRLWNTLEYYQPEESIKRSRSRPPFRIIAGHHGGIISSMIVDPTSRFLITASGDRGWQGESTKVVLIHDIKW